MAPRETANNAYAKFWDDKQKVLWCVMVFSGVVNCSVTKRGRRESQQYSRIRVRAQIKLVYPV